MATYSATIHTIVSYTAIVEAADEEAAEAEALKRAREFGNSAWSDHRGDSVDVNDEWQYGDPQTKEI